MTTRELISSLQIALKKTFDDADVSLAHIAYWAGFFINKYNSAKLMQDPNGGLYLSIYSGIPTVTATTTINPNIIAGRKYAVLPASILDLPNDRAIQYISYTDFDGQCSPPFTSVQFTKVIPNQARVIYYSDYEVPSPSNPYYYRVGNIIYLLGVECIANVELEMGLNTAFNPISDCDIDSEIPLDPGLADLVYRSVLDLGRYIMLIPTENVNEGADAGTGVKQKIVSVNEGTPVSQPSGDTQE